MKNAALTLMLLILIIPITLTCSALAPILKLNPLPSPVNQQSNLAFSGSITNTPTPIGATVTIQYSRSPDGPWTNAATAPYFTYIKASGTYSGNFTGPTQTGTYYIRAYFPTYSAGGNTWMAAVSSLQTIIVTDSPIPPTPPTDYILILVAWLEASLILGIPNWALIIVIAFIISSRR